MSDEIKRGLPEEAAPKEKRHDLPIVVRMIQHARESPGKWFHAEVIGVVAHPVRETLLAVGYESKTMPAGKRGTVLLAVMYPSQNPNSDTHAAPGSTGRSGDHTHVPGGSGETVVPDGSGIPPRSSPATTSRPEPPPREGPAGREARRLRELDEKRKSTDMPAIS